MCLSHRETQFIFLRGVSFCQSSRVKPREKIRHKFTFALNISNLRWEMGVLSLQLCFSKVQGASRTRRICPEGVTSAQKRSLGCPFPAPGSSAWKSLRSVPSICTSLSCTSPRPGQGVPVCRRSFGNEQPQG